MMPNRELPRQQQPSQELPNRPPEQYLSGTPTGARSLDWVRSADQMPLSNRAVGPSVETVQPWELELNRPQPSGPNDPWSILAHTAFDKVKAQEKSKREATAPQLPSNEIVSPAKKAKAGGTDSNPLREASDQFSQSISGKEALSEREVTILPEQPSSEIPPSTQKENQYTTDKKHLITKKSIYDSLDHEIITSLNDPEKKIHMKEFFYIYYAY